MPLYMVLVVAFSVLTGLTPARAVTSATSLHLRPDGHVSLAWLYGGSSTEYRNQIDRAAGLSVISPTWWYLDTDRPGQLELKTDDDLTAYAHQRGIAVWPLFGNHIDSDVTDQVLRDPALFNQIVQGTVAEVRRSGVDGVNVDFENLHDRTRFLLTDLVAALKSALPDLVVSVDVTAMSDTWVLDNWSTAFDREGLGQVADYVMLMAYDQHNTLRRNGPVAGLQWVKESTEFLMRTVPADKIVLGLPFYARDWADDASATQGVSLESTLGMAAMASRLAERSQAVTYDPVAGQDLHTWTDAAGRPHRVWSEDIPSLQRKTDLVASHGLAGIAAWRAGFEPPEVWTALDTKLAAIAAPQTVDPAAPQTVNPASDPASEAGTPSDLFGPPGSEPPSQAIGDQVASGEHIPSEDTSAVDVQADIAAGGTASSDGRVRPALATDHTQASRTGWVIVAAVLLAAVMLPLVIGLAPGRVVLQRGSH